jgi:hypothetical protein
LELSRELARPPWPPSNFANNFRLSVGWRCRAGSSSRRLAIEAAEALGLLEDLHDEILLRTHPKHH